MMFRILGILLILFLPTSSVAEPSYVQSGDHENFSRLVIKLPRNSTWAATVLGQEVIVDLKDHKDSFNTDRVFELISRDRISAISASKSRLKLSLNCSCDVSAFEISGGFLVVDVADPGYATGKTLARLPAGSPPDLRQLTAKYSVSRTSISDTMSERKVPVLPWLGGSQYDPIGRQTLRNTDRPAVFEAPESDPSPALELADLETQLTKQISRAATQGILDAAQKHSIAVDTQRTLETVEMPKRVREPLLPEPNDLSNIRVTTSFDGLYSESSVETTEEGFECPMALIDTLRWNFDRKGFTDELADLRRSLFSEFDKLNTKVARDLAELYVFAGFGAEAINVLEISGINDAEPALYEAAQILEFGAVRRGHFLSRLIGCDTNIALWAIISQKKLSMNSTPATAAALRALNSLPPHLRRILAPKLAEKLLAMSDEAGAATALRSIERVDDKPTGAVLLAKADIERATGLHEQSEASLEQAVSENSEQSAEALIKLIRTKLESRSPIDIEMATLVEAFAQEYAGSETGDALEEVRIIAFAQSGQFDRAFGALNETDFEKEKSNSILADILKNLVSFADDIVFLEYAFQQDARVIAGIDPHLAKDIGERLHSLGFHERANAFSKDQTMISTTIDNSPTNIVLPWEQNPSNKHEEGAGNAPIQETEVEASFSNAGLLAKSKDAIQESAKTRDLITSFLEKQ